MWLLPLSGVIEEVLEPKNYFDSNPCDLEQVVKVVRDGFGRELDFQDIYNHVTSPESVYLLRNEGIKAMASYNRKNFSGCPTLIVEGIAMASEVQGKGVFREMTDCARKDENIICLRTQNPRMYRALEKYCCKVYPCHRNEELGVIFLSIMDEFAKHLNCNIDRYGVVRRYYGGLFYGVEPHHESIDPLFEKLGINKSNGDGLLVVGTVQRGLVFDGFEGFLS